MDHRLTPPHLPADLNDLVLSVGALIVFARTDADAGSHGYSLFVVERGDQGFSRGRKLDKVGLSGQDTAELVFEDVRVAPDNVLGEIGKGLIYLLQRLPKERLSLATQGLAAAEAALAWTQDYVFERTAFGKRIGDLQATRFELADLETEVEVSRAYIQNAALALNDRTLTPTEASKAKLWASEMQVRVTSRSSAGSTRRVTRMPSGPQASECCSASGEVGLYNSRRCS